MIVIVYIISEEEKDIETKIPEYLEDLLEQIKNQEIE